MRLCTRVCTDTLRESALKVDSGRKIPCRIGESNLHRQRAGPTLCQLSYIPTPIILLSFLTHQQTFRVIVLTWTLRLTRHERKLNEIVWLYYEQNLDSVYVHCDDKPEPALCIVLLL